MADSKHTPAGRTERLSRLAAADDTLEAVYDDAVATFIDPPAYARRLGADGRADLVDALVLAHTANRSAQRLGTLPTDPPVDEAVSPPRPMEIVYPSL
jgi:hypothetical protein